MTGRDETSRGDPRSRGDALVVTSVSPVFTNASEVVDVEKHLFLCIILCIDVFGCAHMLTSGHDKCCLAVFICSCIAVLVMSCLLDMTSAHALQC